MLLTIAIPTYNRAAHLRGLVDELVAQIAALDGNDDRAVVFVSDNASTDATARYLDSLAASKHVKVYRHPQNQGAHANVIHCFRHSCSRYVWIIGDDDLPLPGVVKALVDYLDFRSTDLFFIPPKWISGRLVPMEYASAKSQDITELDEKGLSVRASVHTTFISSWVVDKDAYLRNFGADRIDRYGNTLFPHLEWIFGLMRKGRRFASASAPWLLATAGNSGNYPVFEAFSRQYNRTVQDSFEQGTWLHRFHRKNILWNYMPGLIWNTRRGMAGNFGQFDAPAVQSLLSSVYTRSMFFALILSPMIRHQPSKAKWYWMLARIMRKVRSHWIEIWTSHGRRIRPESL